jgi:predicted metal-dependent hydrolase
MSVEAHELACLQKGLSYFRAGDYFAAHDAWEEVWQGLRGSPRLFWQGMIQLVVGAYHYSNGNRRGCQGQWLKALQKCETLLALEALQASAQVQLVHAILLQSLAAVERNDDPLPALRAFATESMSEAWFTFV